MATRNPGLLFALLSVAALACETGAPQQGQAQPAEGQLGPPGQAGQQDQPGDKDQAEKGDEALRLQGSWRMELSAEQKDRYRLITLAFRDPPPSEDEIKELALGSDDQTMLEMIQQRMAEDPNDPQLAEIRSSLQGYQDSSLEITADQLRFSWGDRQEVYAYTVEESGTGSFTITTRALDGEQPNESVTIALEGENRMSVTPEGGSEGDKAYYSKQEGAEPEKGPQGPKEPMEPPEGDPPAGEQAVEG